MKKYILGMTIVSMLSTVNMGLAMEKGKKGKKEMPITSLSPKQVAELRKAVKGMKDKPLSESRKEQLIINDYANKYYIDERTDDPFVKAKVKEASKIYKLKKYGPNYFDPEKDSGLLYMAPTGNQPAKGAFVKSSSKKKTKK